MVFFNCSGSGALRCVCMSKMFLCQHVLQKEPVGNPIPAPDFGLPPDLGRFPAKFPIHRVGSTSQSRTH